MKATSAKKNYSFNHAIYLALILFGFVTCSSFIGASTPENETQSDSSIESTIEKSVEVKETSVEPIVPEPKVDFDAIHYAAVTYWVEDYYAVVTSTGADPVLDVYIESHAPHVLLIHIDGALWYNARPDQQRSITHSFNQLWLKANITAAQAYAEEKALESTPSTNGARIKILDSIGTELAGVGIWGNLYVKD